MTNPNEQSTHDEEHRNVEAAMKRAAEMAKQKAKQAGHGVLVYRDGKIEELPVDSEEIKQGT